MRKAFVIATWLGVVGGVVALASPQEGAEASPGAAVEARAQAEVEILLSRHRGTERIASLPYTLRLSEGRDKRARLRVGVEVPVRVETSASVQSFQYKNVGTHIDCSAVAIAAPRGGGRGAHELTLAVEHSAVVPATSEVEAPFEGAPMFSTFRIESFLELADGESAELVSSTDPVTGEVMRIRVTLRMR